MEPQKKTIPATRWLFGIKNGTPFLPSQLLERYLSKLPLKGFPYADAVAFWRCPAAAGGLERD